MKKAVVGNADNTAPKQIKTTSLNTTFNLKYLSGDGYGIVGGI